MRNVEYQFSLRKRLGSYKIVEANKIKMDEKIKEIVREIQHNYCGEPVETKLYFAIERGIKIGRKSFSNLTDVGIDFDETQSD